VKERGSSPIELALGVLLILVPVALMVLSFGPWLERRSFVRVAAREVARFYITSDGADSSPQLLAMAGTYRIDTVRLGLCGAEPAEVHADGGIASDCPPLDQVADLGAAGGGVSATVEVDVPVFVLPWSDTDGNRRTVGGVVVSATHTEYVDLYRSFP
jgi:hypothetical protein